MTKTKPTTLKQTSQILSDEIEMYRRSWTELIGSNKGKITNKHALRTMAGLKRAKQVVDNLIKITS